MSKYSTCLICLALCSAAYANVEGELNSAVFELQYRSISEPNHKLLRYSSIQFSNMKIRTTPFIENLKRQGMELELIPMRSMLGAQYAAVEMVSGEPAALCIDLNTDGKLSSDERILPSLYGNYGEACIEFITPNFTMKTKWGNVPYRLRLVNMPELALSSGRKYAFYWKPSCIWEGESHIDGKWVRIRFYDSGADGTYSDYRRDKVGFEGLRPTFYSTPWEELSGLLSLESRYYRLTVTGQPREGGRFRAILTRDAIPLGRLDFALASGKKNALSMVSITIKDADDASSLLEFGSYPFPAIPAGAYKIGSGAFNRAETDGTQWKYHVSGDFDIRIKPKETTTLELGKPKLAVSVWEERKEKKNTRELRTATYMNGSGAITLGSIAEIEVYARGQAGEMYWHTERMITGADSSGRRAEKMTPLLQITDSKGKRIAEHKMEYG
jgi:hypothetical protein